PEALHGPTLPTFMIHPRTAAASGVSGDLAAEPDGELLRTFCASRSSEAFAEMVRRHRPMVYRTCLRLLANSADADDASQATFLRRARKPALVKHNLAAWLHKAAHDTAGTRAQSRGRPARREQAPAQPEAAPPADEQDQLREEIDAALDRLPGHL